MKKIGQKIIKKQVIIGIVVGLVAGVVLWFFVEIILGNDCECCGCMDVESLERKRNSN